MVQRLFTNKLALPLLIALFGLIAFVPFLGAVPLFDWDEINFAESAREMLVTGDYFRVLINFEPFWEKPPFFFWLQALSMQLFGVTEFAARLPNALCGIITLLAIYSVGKREVSAKFGLWWVVIHIASLLPFMYFKSGIIDPWFNLFIFLSIYFLYRSIESRKRAVKWAIIAGLFSGMAIITKGPVGFLLLALTFFVWWGFATFKKVAPMRAVLAFAFTALVVTCLWFGPETIRNGPWFIQEFILYQIDLFVNPVAGHAQPFFYHFVVVLLGCFPASVFALPMLFKYRAVDNTTHFVRWMRILFWVVMILFSIVTTKIVHYSSMAYLPLSFLAALHIYRSYKAKEGFPKWQMIWAKIQGAILGIALVALPILMMYKQHWLGLINDPFAVENLKAPVDWSWLDTLPGVLVLVVSLILISSKMNRQRLGLVTALLAIAWFGALTIIVPKVHGFTQQALVKFYGSIAGQDCYVALYNHKSYAHYFYAEVQQDGYTQAKPASTLLVTDALDKPAYFVARFGKDEDLKIREDVELMYEENGWVFYTRIP